MVGFKVEENLQDSSLFCIPKLSSVMHMAWHTGRGQWKCAKSRHVTYEQLHTYTDNQRWTFYKIMAFVIISLFSFFFFFIDRHHHLHRWVIYTFTWNETFTRIIMSDMCWAYVLVQEMYLCSYKYKVEKFYLFYVNLYFSFLLDNIIISVQYKEGYLLNAYKKGYDEDSIIGHLCSWLFNWIYYY